MRKKCISSLFFFILVLPLFGQADSTATNIDTTTFVYGNVMYEKGKYEKSIAIYENLLAQNGPSATLYYNLGNCYYKTDKLGLSVLNYERALFYDGRKEDIKYNLELVNLRIRDKMDPINQSLVTIWSHNFIKIFSVHSWAFFCILFLWTALSGFAIYRYAKKRNFQRYGFFGFVISLVIFVLTLVSVFARNNYDKNYQFAIVMSPSSIVKSEPNESSTNMFLIHEGLKVQVLESDNNWTEVKMPDGNVGWLKNEDIVAVGDMIL